MTAEITVLPGLDRTIQDLPLVDQHAHGVTGHDLPRAAFEELITEARGLDWMTPFDSQLGHAVLRHCAPVLGLDPFPSPEEYLARRARLGAAEVNRLLLGAAGAGHYLIEAGRRPEEVLGASAMAEVTGVPVDEVVSLEAVAERVAASGVSAAGFAGRFAAELGERARTARALKSVAACGLDPEPPTPAEVTEAAGGWLAAGGRLEDRVLLRHLIWAGLETGLPLQFPTGFGGPGRAHPLPLRGLIERAGGTGAPLVLLHCYPYHREAGYLAHAYPHVYLDVAVRRTGARSAAVVAESLEVAPFAKIMFSSGGRGPAELHFLGAELWRRAMSRVLGGFVTDGDWSSAQAARVATMIGADNARRVYRLGGAA